MMQSDYDNSLQSYFTDMERPRDMFKEYVSAEKLPKHLIVFHGVGGVGKSSLLRMFRLHCRSEKIPVALASGDDAKSVLDVVTCWTEDLKGDGIRFSAFSKTLESYRAIQAKVEEQVKKSQNKVADIASKVASKTAEAAGGALLGAALGSIIPGIGMIAGAVSGMGAEALTDWLRGFLSKPDIDLLLDPAKKLSADFFEDLAKAAEKQRTVLLLDTFEQMSALEDWVGEVGQKIHPNVLMVIAGRKLPNWNRVWSGWMMSAQVEELKPMTEDIMRQLIHRYYATMRGGKPDQAQVEAIIRFARGLPMVVTSAVQLWVKYGVEDFQLVKAEIVANLVDRLMEGVPGALIPALEAVAVVRWFDQPILRAVMNKEDVRDVYNELRRFPFVRTRVEGLALHDSVRELMDENLRVQDSERHAELHGRAAIYFEKRLDKSAGGEETERLGLERLYHRVRTHEETGIKIFQKMAEELAQNRLVNRLRALLNDVNTYPLEKQNSRLWRSYYTAWLMEVEIRPTDAEKIYRSIAESEYVEPKLRAYSLSSYGYFLSKVHRSMQEQSDGINILKQSLELVPLDIHLVNSLFILEKRYRYVGKWDEANFYQEKYIKFFKENGDNYGLLSAYIQKRAIHAGNGEWKELSIAHRLGLQILPALPEHSYLRAKYLASTTWARALAGNYNETENNVRQGLKISREINDLASIREFSQNLAILLAKQDRFDEAAEHLGVSLKISQDFGSDYANKQAYIQGWWGMLLIRQGKLTEAEEKLVLSLKLREQFKLEPDIPEVMVWLGELSELRKEWNQATDWYNNSLDLRWTGRRNFESAALTSLIRVKHAQKDIAAIPSLLAEAELLAQLYEYNDHLAALRLTQGHLTWENGNQDETLVFYQKAMIYALRYNRFLLDELLNGRPQGTPLHPIIPYCLECGEDGRKILSALRAWWKTGVNDIGTLRPDTVSPIPQEIPLLEAEEIAREREPGDGSMQRTVVEQFEAAIDR